MISSVNGLDDELKAVRLKAEFRLDGYRFGYSPTTPNSVAPPMVRQDANHAFHHAFLAMNSLVTSKATTVASGMTKRRGRLR